MKCLFLDYIQLLMIGHVIWVTKVDQTVKKSPLSHQKMKCLFLDYIQLLMISQAIQVMKVNRNAKKGPLSHQKMKCLFLDYIQLLMIGQAFWTMKVDQNGREYLWKITLLHGQLCHKPYGFLAIGYDPIEYNSVMNQIPTQVKQTQRIITLAIYPDERSIVQYVVQSSAIQSSFVATSMFTIICWEKYVQF